MQQIRTLLARYALPEIIFLFVAFLLTYFAVGWGLSTAIPELDSYAQLIGYAARIIGIGLGLNILAEVFVLAVQRKTPLQIPTLKQFTQVWSVFFASIAIFVGLTLSLASTIISIPWLFFVTAYLSLLFSIFTIREIRKQEVLPVNNNAQNGETQDKTVGADSPQYKLARSLMAYVLVGITILGFITITQSINKAEASNQLFSAILPLFGTWVGTILAFYFTKENLDAARASVTQLVNKITSTEEKLRATSVRDKMIFLTQMFIVRQEDQAKDKLLEKLEEMDKEAQRLGVKSGRWNRIPVLNNSNQPVFVVHRSIINEFLTTSAAKGAGVNLSNLTFKNMCDDPDVSNLLKSTFQTVKLEDTLQTAKERLDKMKDQNCQDVFVTDDGTERGKVIGWLTNVIIQEASTV
jgi:hypothetical protein